MKSVDIVVPVRNEALYIENNLRFLYKYLNKIKKYDWRVIVLESGSTDDTFEVSRQMENKFKKLKAIHLDFPGRDWALIYTWGKSKADIRLYVDADMSTHPRHVIELIKAIDSGYDIAIGSRMKKGAIVKRPIRRKILSYIYNYLLIPLFLPTGVEDAQCGAKAINPRVAKKILPKLSKQNGFLDSELLAVANAKGYKIKEIPVEWTESERASTMSVSKNIPKFLRNLSLTRNKIKEGFYD